MPERFCVSQINRYICVLGRQPKISLAELEAVFGHENVCTISGNLALLTTSQTPDVTKLGGTLKIARILDQSPLDYLYSLPHGKLTIGVSDYRRHASSKTSQQEGLKLKKQLVREGYSARIIPNQSADLSTATSHHNKLGLSPNKIELIYTDRLIGLSIGAQNITAYARRDQARPARDARVGMLPPKLAQILINLAAQGQTGHLLDPFCGTGVILQEALLMGNSAYGTDLEPRMIEMTRKNLEWLDKKDSLNYKLEPGDATNYKWTGSINFIATETYLGQAFSAPPSEVKLKDVQHVTKSIITGFLKNISPQLDKNTCLALAIPAWKRPNGSFSHLKILDELDRLGYNLEKYSNLEQSDLLYHREDQIVAREILVLRSK